MPDRGTELTQALRDTEDAVRELSEKVDINEATAAAAKTAAEDARTAAYKSARASRVALAGWVFGTILTVAVGLVVLGVERNQDRIDELQRVQTAETDRNRQGQCAVNALFLQFEPRTITNPGYTEDQRRQQIAAYATLKQISADLGCPKP